MEDIARRPVTLSEREQFLEHVPARTPLAALHRVHHLDDAGVERRLDAAPPR